MKTILSKGSGNAHDLVKELVKRGYLPPYMESGANQLADMLEMLPRLRDKEGDVHGKIVIEEEHLPNHARLAHQPLRQLNRVLGKRTEQEKGSITDYFD